MFPFTVYLEVVLMTSLLYPQYGSLSIFRDSELFDINQVLKLIRVPYPYISSTVIIESNPYVSSIMSKSKFIKHLKELNIEELKHELLDLFAKVPEVRKHYAMELGTDKEREKIFNKAKKEIEAKYATKSYRKPRRPRIQKINSILSMMRKASIFDHEMADLYLFDIEAALVFIVKYHFYSQVLGNHIRSVFEKALNIIAQEQVTEMYQERINRILDRSIVIPELHLTLRSDFKRILDD